MEPRRGTNTDRTDETDKYLVAFMFFMKHPEPQHMLGLRVGGKKGLDAY